jgi:hypothetical protein
MKRPVLGAEDGATFHGRVVPVDGQFRAKCWAELALPTSHQAEEERCRICDTQLDAEYWIHEQAIARGFERYSLSRE